MTRRYLVVFELDEDHEAMTDQVRDVIHLMDAHQRESMVGLALELTIPETLSIRDVTEVETAELNL